MLIKVEIFEQQGKIIFRVAEHEPEPVHGRLIAIHSFRTEQSGTETMFVEGLCPRQLSVTTLVDAYVYGMNWWQQQDEN